MQIQLKYWSFVLLFSIYTWGQNPDASLSMSHEEQVLRSAYAKLAFAAQVYTVLQIAQDYQSKRGSFDPELVRQRLTNAEISFKLDNVRAGNLSDISQVRYADLITKPNGEDALPVTTGYWTYSTDQPMQKKTAIASASWTKGQILSEDWNVSFGKAMKMIQAAGAEDVSPYNRYAAAHVTVTFQGRSRSYDTLFEFGVDSKQQERILPVDTVIGNSALLFYIKNSVYPAALLETGIRKIPFVADWLRSNAVSGVPGGTHEPTCDLETLQCGLAADDVRRALSPTPTGSLRYPGFQGRPRLVEAAFHPFVPGVFMMQSDLCSLYNFSAGPTPGSTPVDQTFHISGQHFMTYTQSSSCTYSSGNNSNGACNTQCSATISGTPNESGLTTSSCHEAEISQVVGGTATGNGTAASCTASVAMGVKACLFCACSVSFSVSGGGASASISSDGFYTVQQNNTNNCGQQTPPSGGGGGGGGGPVQEYDPGTSPIILDIGNEGFHLTSAQNGVIFDIRGDGNPIHIAWTDPHFRNAFLTLPGPDGLVHSGKQLFGNFTAQPPSNRPNGFLALAQFDKPENGGNGDGVIDTKDAIFSQLRLWTDDNHDGICQPSELHTLPELGVSSISLRYHFSRMEDQYGNVFRYRSRINPPIPSDQSEVGKTAYDVFFTTVQ